MTFYELYVIMFFCILLLILKLNTTMTNAQKDFLKKELLMLTFRGGLQTRNENGLVYASKDERKRKAMRDSIQAFLEMYVAEIQKNRFIDEATHLQKIVELSNTISEKHGDILKDGRFRIGVSQKIINLYLKYMWVIGELGEVEPPHCPFDGIMKAHLEKSIGIKGLEPWTKFNDIKDYESYVNAAKKAAGNASIAQWELAVFEKEREALNK